LRRVADKVPDRSERPSSAPGRFRPVENVDDHFREWTFATLGVGLRCSGDHVGKEQDTERKSCRAAL